MDENLEQFVRDSFENAIAAGHIQVFYQPVIRSISRKLCSFEALARWIDPERGFLRPDQFIPVLEKAHLIHLLDTHVVYQACARIRESVETGATPIPISVNLSRLDFELCDVFAMVEHAANSYQIPHDFLYIEITESLIAERGGHMRDVIERFRSAGFQIWMDDFGSGYSSLNVLKDFSFDEIKLDMQFLTSFDQRSRRIMTSVIQMAKEIDIHTLAEGVETEEQFRYLRNIGCEKVQGYYFGKPAPYEEALANLAAKGIEVERPVERQYYDSIGRVDVLSAVPFMTREEKDSLTTARQLNSIPLAIAEARQEGFRVLFCNAAFEETARGTGLVAGIFEQESLRKLQPYTLLPEQIIKLIDSTRSDEMGRMFFISNEEYYELQTKCIAQSPEAYCVLFRLSNLSKASEAKKTNWLDDGLRQLYTLFERVTLIDMESDSIMPLYVATREDLVSGRSGLNKLRHEYAERWIFPEDREEYLAFSDYRTLEERMTGRTNVSRILRTLVGHGQYEWKKYTFMKLRDLTYVELIRSVRADVEEFADKGLGESGFAQSSKDVSEERVWRTVLDSGIIRLFWKDLDRRFLGVSKGFLDYYGFGSAEDVIGKNDEDLGWHVQPGHYKSDEERVISEVITTHNEPGQCICDGENRDIIASKTPLYDFNGKIQGLVGFFMDKDLITVHDSRGSETKRRDILTGLLNSRGIHEDVRVSKDEYFLRGSDFVRLNVGIDDFASINRQYGFDFGDKVITALGQALKRSFGASSSVGRIAGHDFVVLRAVRDADESANMRAEARKIAERIREIDGIPVTLYISAGSCLFSETEDLEEQAKKASIRQLADHGDDASTTRRQRRAADIFHPYDDLPISYSVYKVQLDGDGRTSDVQIFYVNHAFEERCGMDASQLLGRSTRTLFPSLDEEWYDQARRAAYGGEIITDRMYYAPAGYTYFKTVSQVIHSGYCCITYQEIDD